MSQGDALSPDGWWFWDGTAWVPAVSPDGSWRWDGSAWVTNDGEPARTRWPRIVRVLVTIFGVAFVTIVGVVFAGLFAIQEWEDKIGCGSVDPTDPANYSVVSIRNDTRYPVVVSGCNGGYCNLLDHVLLRPGKHLSDLDAACRASGSAMTSFRLSTVDGTTIGYIAVDSPRSRDDLVYPVSHAQSRRKLAAIPDRNRLLPATRP